MARASQSVYRRRRIIVFGSLGVTLSLLAGVTTIALAPLPDASVSPLTSTDLTSAPAQLTMPPFGTTVLSADGFGILSEQNLDVPAPIASMAKVITALVVLDARPITPGNPGPSITFDANDVDALNRSIQNAESRADVIEGMTLSERDALTIMLVESANNYAWSLARWAFGSEENYVSLANEWLTSHGFTSTVVTDASGLNPATQSTPRDLLGIAALALDNEVTAGAVSTVSTSIDPIGEIDNSNKLLGILGVNGVKTGTTDEAGACLLFSADLPVGDSTVRLIGVTLGAPDHPSLDSALTEFLGSVQRGFHIVTPTESGKPLATETTAWGTATNLVAGETLSRVVWSSTPVNVTLPSAVTSIGASQSSAGNALITVGGETTPVPLIRETSVDDPGFFWRVSHLTALFAH